RGKLGTWGEMKGGELADAGGDGDGNLATCKEHDGSEEGALSMYELSSMVGAGMELKNPA
ncbi:MAG: hypothetical protein Q9175_008085, partial [Cornicularia normoerica]